MAANPPFASILQFFSSFVSGSRLVDGGDCLLLARMIGQATSGITALVGGGLSSATPVLNIGLSEVDTCATDSDSVQLPPAIPGSSITVWNATGHTLAVFGCGSNLNNSNTADVIASASSNATATSQTIATTKTAVFNCFKAGVWKMMLTG